MGKLELKLLGSLEIQLDGNPVPELKSKKSQALLCYLAVTMTQHTRSRLSGMFWGGMPESKARMNLSQALTTLRRNFQPFIITTRNFISLNTDSDVWTDVNALNEVDPDNLDSLHKVARQYSGDFLEGFYIPGSPEFEFWTLGERSRCRENILRVLDRLVGHYVSQSVPDWDSAIEFILQKIAIEPWHEESHRKLIGLYALSGQRSKALKQFEFCRQILIDELGVKPGADTTDLYEQLRGSSANITRNSADNILASIFSKEMRLSRRRQSRRKPIASNIRPSITDFIGREQELQQLEKLLHQQKSRLVTITGTGGIGKTSLGLKFAEKYLAVSHYHALEDGLSDNPFPDGIFFVSLEAVISGEAILPAIAEAIGFRMDRGDEQLLNYLSHRHILLILDNFEHLLHSANIITTIVSSAPGVQILVTSREKLNLQGEQVFPLQGLPYTANLGTSTAFSPAGKLFIKTAQRQDPLFFVDEADLDHLSEICKMVEGMPLALELAAIWTRSLSLASIASQIQQNLQFLSTKMSNLPARHRSIRAVIKGSIEQLTPEMQNLFYQLAIFNDGFTLEAAEKVAGATFDDLSLFLDKSLLRFSRSHDRYFLHSLLHQYGKEVLSRDKHAFEKLNKQHSHFYCWWFSDQSNPETMISVGQKKCLDSMMADLENTRQAWDWAIKHHDYERLIGKPNSLGYYFIYRAGYVEGARIFQELLDVIQEDPGNHDQYYGLTCASLTVWLAFFLDITGQSESAHSMLKFSEELLNSPLLENLDTRATKAHYLTIFARIHLSRKQVSRQDILAEALQLYRDVDHPFGLPFGLITNARFALFEGNHQQAEKNLLESRAIYEKTGNQIGLTISLAGLGNHAFVQNDYRLARSFFKQSISIAREFKSPERVIPAVLFLGTARLYSGQFKRAHQDFSIVISESEVRGLLGFQAYAQYFLGFNWLHRGDYQRSIECASAALPLAHQTGEIEIVSLSRALFAAVDLKYGKWHEAYEGFCEAQEIQSNGKFVRVLFGEDCVNLGKACALLGLGETDKAQLTLSTYLQDAMASHRLDKALFAVAGFTSLSAELGDIFLSVRLFRFMMSQPLLHNSCWINDIVTRPIMNQLSAHPEAWQEQAEPSGIWDIIRELKSQF